MMSMNWIENYIKAGSSQTSTEELEMLAHSDNHKIRMRVAENPNVSNKILEYLAKDSDADVRLAVALNHACSQDTIFELACDPDPTVRHGLAEDPMAPYKVLQALADDVNPYVSCRAQKTLQKLTMMKTHSAKSQPMALRSGMRIQCLA
jgi:hypothetical protein